MDRLDFTQRKSGTTTMILLLGGEKGGTGKSTLATNLAAWQAVQGRDVILVDTDVQRTAANWVDRRNLWNGVPVVQCAERRGNVFDALRDLAKRYEEVIVDAGGRDSEELRTALVAAHKVYVPLRASQPDLETSLHMNELVTLARGMNPALEARMLIALAPTNPSIKETADVQELLRELSAPAVEPEIDPAALEAFAAGAREQRGAKGELPPWDRFDPSDKPRYNVAIRLNDYQLAMLRYLAEARDTSQHKLLQKHLIPILKQLALEEFESNRVKSS